MPGSHKGGSADHSNKETENKSNSPIEKLKQESRKDDGNVNIHAGTEAEQRKKDRSYKASSRAKAAHFQPKPSSEKSDADVTEQQSTVTKAKTP